MQEYPRNLCIYDDLYDNLKLRWSSQKFVQDIRSWLALTARGELHQEDQPLEPILVDYLGHIVIPSGFENGATHNQLTVRRISENQEKPFFLLQYAPPDQGNNVEILASIHRCKPRTHGVIHRMPTSLEDLNSITISDELDIIAELRENLKRWYNNRTYLDAQLLLIIEFPQKRKDESSPEVIERWAFFIFDASDTINPNGMNVRELGYNIGIWQSFGSQTALLLDTDLSMSGNNVGIAALNVIRDIDRFSATAISGANQLVTDRFVAVGVGALGSQVVMNAARTGFGTWTLIDHDYLMPHNLVRHSLNRVFVGYNKAEAVAFEANSIFGGTGISSAISADVLHLGRKAGEVSKAIEEANVILEMSTSESVARMLARDTNSNARRISLFLTPTGNDLVMLAEDENRSFMLDALEMQYYRAILSNDLLEGHLDLSDERYRYAQSCRDVTSRLPQYLVALHASIATRALRTVVRDTSANVAIWQAQEDGTVRRVDVIPAEVVCFVKDGWEIITDEALLENLYKMRNDKLPNETGGVLLGTYDMERKIIYIVDALSSPPDSEEWPTLYIRGCESLNENVTNLSKKVHGMINYIGEWHTHPDGAGTCPSNDDLKVVNWLEGIMGSAGLPAVMMIVEQPGRVSYCVAKT